MCAIHTHTEVTPWMSSKYLSPNYLDEFSNATAFSEHYNGENGGFNNGPNTGGGGSSGSGVGTGYDNGFYHERYPFNRSSSTSSNSNSWNINNNNNNVGDGYAGRFNRFDTRFVNYTEPKYYLGELTFNGFSCFVCMYMYIQY